MSVGVRRDLVVLSAFVAAWSLLGGVRADAVGDRSGDASTSSTTATTAPSTTTTTVLPTTTTTVAPAPALVRASVPAPADRIGEAIRRWFPEIEQEARRIAFCESSFRADAVSPGGGSRGLFQIHTVHRESFAAVTGVAYDEGVFDPELNARFARWLYDEQGWKPWVCA